MVVRFMTLIFVVVFFGSLTRSLAQEDSWKTISPAGESFTTLMPTQAVEVSRLIPLSDHDSVRERVYYSLAPGKRYMIVSFMKTAPDRLMALES